jgi:ATP-dependent RNA helicase DHX29
MPNHDDYKDSSRSRRVHAKSTHGTLVSLLDELPSLPVIASTTTSSTNDDVNVSESRRRRHILQRRVTVLYDALLQLGFEEQEYVEEILIRTQAAGLTEALDWACRFVATRHLPPFLTDENAVVDDNNSMSMLLQDPHRLHVIPAKQNNNNKSERMNEPSMIVHSDSTTTRGAPDEQPPLLVMASPRTNRQPSTTMDDDDDDDDDRAAQKAWLLARYEYEDDDEYDSVEEQQEEVVMVDAAASTTPSLQRQLHEMEQEYEQLNAIVVDEAQQYVMSKHEVKSMKKRHKALQKQLERVRRKVKQQQQQDEQQQARNAQNEANEDEQGAMMDLFGCDNNNEEQVENGAFDLFRDSNEAATPKQNDAAVHVPEVAPPATRHVVPDFSIPKQWTGQTPKQVLRERCKKLKCGPPKFHKQRHFGGGVVLTIACKPNRRVSIIQEQDEGPFFQDWEETQNYLATRALYEMDSSLPIYRILPPAFRDLWTSWLDTAKQKQDEKQQEVDNAKQQHMQQLVDAILSRQSETKTKKGALKMEETTEDSELEDKDANVVVPDTWDDSSEESDEKPTVKPNKVSEKGIRLQQFFQKRRETPHYKAMLESRQDLPMYSYRQDLLDTIRDNQVTVLCAETGAGKTTQCGQFLLEEALNDGFGNEISILCTQPRRVSAISVAERVSEEFGDKHVGDTIGYHIRLESKKSVRTKLLFCTTGVVLRRLQDDPNLVGVTHVLVDEVHERQWQIDFLLIALRRLIHTTRKDLKVVLVGEQCSGEVLVAHCCTNLSLCSVCFYVLTDVSNARCRTIYKILSRSSPTKSAWTNLSSDELLFRRSYRCHRSRG